MYAFPTTVCGTRIVSRDSSNAKPLLNYLALDNPYNNSTVLDRREIEQVFCKQADRGLRSQSVLGWRIIHESPLPILTGLLVSVLLTIMHVTNLATIQGTAVLKRCLTQEWMV